MQPYKSLQMDNFVIPFWTAKGFNKCFELPWIREGFKIVIILLHYVSVVWFCLFASFIAIKLISLYYWTVKTQAVAIFPLNGLTRGKDISFGRNPPGTLSNVRPAQGPDNTRTGSYQFFGLRRSFIYFPNRGGLDTKKSITLLASIYHEGRAGPIFHYKPNGWAVHFWMVTPRTLFVRFARRKGLRLTTPVASRTVVPRRWQFVGATYNYRTGVAKLFVNSRFVAAKRIGRIRLATNYPVRMGAIGRDKRYFKGRIACMQVYNGALSRWQIISKKKRCYRSKSIHFFLQWFPHHLPVISLTFVIFPCVSII